jgi:hypothetical protein
MLALTHPRANLLAVVTNVTSFYTPLAASALIGYYTPRTSTTTAALGVRGPLTADAYLSTRSFDVGEYASKLGFHWRDRPRAPLRWEARGEDARPALDVYRTALAAAADGSVKIVSIGFFENVGHSHRTP